MNNHRLELLESRLSRIERRLESHNKRTDEAIPALIAAARPIVVKAAQLVIKNLPNILKAISAVADNLEKSDSSGNADSVNKLREFVNMGEELNTFMDSLEKASAE